MIVLITGATSGIGKATAYKLAQEGKKLILLGRRAERLEALKNELSAITEVLTIAADVRDWEQLQKKLTLSAPWSQIDVLINNAGNAYGLAPIHEGELSDWNAMLDINVKGILHVSKLVLPGMIERGSGMVINIGSIAGKESYPNGNVYCASKAAVDALTQGMRMDLFKKGIRVGAIHPGLVETEFSLVRFQGDEERAAQVYKGYTPLHPEDIADCISFMLSRPKHVQIADLLILPSDQASATLVNKQS
jgi:3-hydroxy acid dehydrogenase / malonic semialdehyde reductase